MGPGARGREGPRVEPGAAPGASAPGRGAPLTAFIDTNVIIRHLTGDPPAVARRATAALASDEPLLLCDVVLAECVYVLASVYEVPRAGGPPHAFRHRPPDHHHHRHARAAARARHLRA
ncbi:MAG: type II toxin-antitoxin system VapC family toxin [Actinobacteria bacterium]|nr:type II toxin-antitoxin system VapC family toxin [Actinomycetota bacterium]